VQIEEEFETEIRGIAVKRCENGIRFVVTMANEEVAEESDFEELVTKYPKKLCRALVQEMFPVAA
jgi:hypothetical protein